MMSPSVTAMSPRGKAVRQAFLDALKGTDEDTVVFMSDTFYDDLKSGSTGGAGGGAGSGSSASGAIPDRETASTMVDSVVTTTVDSGMLEGDVADITKAIVDTLELAGVAGDPTVAAKAAAAKDTSGPQGAEMLIGEKGVAVLAEDGEWHDAVIKAAHDDGARFTVLFTEYGKPQDVTRKELVLDCEIAHDEDEDGECEICARTMPLTRHHLTPRVTHEKYKKQGCTDEFLNTCALICRQCHNAVHRFKDNWTLAAEYNTVEKLMATPHMQKWATWAATLRPIKVAERKLPKKK